MDLKKSLIKILLDTGFEKRIDRIGCESYKLDIKEFYNPNIQEKELRFTIEIDDNRYIEFITARYDTEFKFYRIKNFMIFDKYNRIESCINYIKSIQILNARLRKYKINNLLNE